MDERSSIAFLILVGLWVGYILLRVFSKMTYIQYSVIFVISLIISLLLYPVLKEFSVIPGILSWVYFVLLPFGMHLFRKK